MAAGLLLMAATGAKAQLRVEFCNEAADTAALTQMLVEVESGDAQGQALVAEFGRRLLDRPYRAGTLEGEPETLRVCTEAFDCTTLVETALAAAITVDSRRSSWRDFVYNLRQLRYRGGEINGYGSRLHYVSDWITDNSHRGNLQEVTDRIGVQPNYAIKTLDFMSQNRDKYPAMKEDAAYEAIKNSEIGYRSHRFPYLKPQNLKHAKLREGDVVAFTSTVKGLDVSHMGIIVMLEGGKPGLLHASSAAGRVVIDKLSLEEYLKRNSRTMTGVRVFRLR